MKRKIFSIFFALVLVLGLSLVTAVPAGAVGNEYILYHSLDSVTADLFKDIPGTTLSSDGTCLKIEWESAEYGGVRWKPMPGYDTGQTYDLTGTTIEFDVLWHLTSEGRPTMPEDWPEEDWRGIHLRVYSAMWDSANNQWLENELGSSGAYWTGTGTVVYMPNAHVETSDAWVHYSYIIDVPGEDQDCRSETYDPDAAEWWVDVGWENRTFDVTSVYKIQIDATNWDWTEGDYLLLNELKVVPPSDVWVADDGDDSNPGTEATPFATIQRGINTVAPGGTVNVAAGTYNEIVTIDKSLTLLGAKPDEDARTRDTSSGESILDGSSLSPGDSGFTIASGVSGVTIDGFEITGYIKHPDYGGGGSAVFAYFNNGEPTGTSNITVQNNYMHDLGWNAISVSNEEGWTQSEWLIKYNLIEDFSYAGIELTNVIESQVLDNKILAPTAIVYDPGDAGVGIEIAVRAQAGQTIEVTNVLVEGNEITGAFPMGPEGPWGEPQISRAGINLLSRTYAVDADATLSGVTVRENIVSDGGANLRAGILAVAESRSNGPATIANLVVEDNTLDGNNVGFEVEDLTGGTHSLVTVNYNNIENNIVYGVNNLGAGTLDATNNWWRNASGPTHADSPFGIGDEVSGDVTYNPWLLEPVTEAVPQPPTYHKTLALKDGWTLISVDKAVAEPIWVGTNLLLAEDLPEETIYALKYAPTGGFPEAIPTDLEPLTSIYVLTDGGGGVGINYAADGPTVYTKELEAGWNLISTTSSDITANALLSQLRFTTVGTQLWPGLTTLVSQEDYNQFSVGFYDATLTEADWNALALKTLEPFDGYWAYMEAADTFEVIP